ncbi:hypothetical protein M9H77_27785 [Catharanthus roseus]|uniref:Uncharacterized protein n=1 Tax=Catharanthus roseus TaxID=4058 RepID=A0ACC0ADH2_CATRO|nr:hypothetical protein M9H77_27785 [Catharanthus roseus]
MHFVSTRNLFQILIILIYYLVNLTEASDFDYTIYVVNGLPDNSHLLRVHCFSGDDDLGYHDLKVNENIHWTFTPNRFGTTKFYCHLWWNDKERGFGAYTRRIAEFYCNNRSTGIGGLCWWLPKSDGIYIANVTNPPSNYLIKVNDWMPIGSGGV